MPGQLTHREMLSYGLKQGEAWGDQRRELERAFDRADRSSRSMSSGGLPSGSQTQALQRQYSTGSASLTSANGYARHSGYGSGHLPRADYPLQGGRATYAQDPRIIQYREPSSRSVSSRTSSPLPSYASCTYGRSYSHGYAPSSNYTPSTYQSHSGSSRYSGYGHSRSGSSSYTPRSLYESDDEDYTHALSSGVESEPHFASGYAETTYIVEPSDSGSEASYSGEDSSYGDSESERGDSGSGYSGSEGDSVYSEGADDEYDYDDGGSYSDDGGYYSDD